MEFETIFDSDVRCSVVLSPDVALRHAVGLGLAPMARRALERGAEISQALADEVFLVQPELDRLFADRGARITARALRNVRAITPDVVRAIMDRAAPDDKALFVEAFSLTLAAQSESNASGENMPITIVLGCAKEHLRDLFFKSVEQNNESIALFIAEREGFFYEICGWSDNIYNSILDQLIFQVASRGMIRLFERILSCLELYHKTSCRAIETAINQNQIEFVRTFAKRFKLCITDRLVEESFYYGKWEIAAILIECDLPFRSKSERFYRVAHYGETKLVSLMVEKYKMDVRSKNDRVLRNAVEGNHHELLAYLFSAGVPANANRGRIFHRAVELGDINIVRLFLDHGARVDMALEHAVASPMLVDLLAARGASPLVRRGAALARAARQGHAASLARMLTLVPVNSLVNRLILTRALHKAVKHSRHACAAMLVEHGASARWLHLGKLTTDEKTSAECCVMQAPLEPGEFYRRCTSNVAHTTTAIYAVDKFKEICPMCKLPLDPRVFRNV